jgi:tetratricopeptide (TPR) repeat protein
VAFPLAALAVSACAVVPTGDARLFHDALFQPPAGAHRRGGVFATSPAMRDYVHREIAPQIDARGPQQGLFDALHARGLKLDYDSAVTRNAAQAFEARAGNCLSLVIMTAALAKELGLEVKYQRVVSEDMWSRSGETYFASAHVNVTLARKYRDPRVRFDEKQMLTIDFMPPTANAFPAHLGSLGARGGRHVHEQPRRRGARGGPAGRRVLVGARGDRAGPGYSSAYNTLGVVYKKHGNLREAEAVLASVLEREPRNVNAMQNLALVYNDQGREREADALTERLERLQPNPPFHDFDLGIAAMQAGDYRRARRLFTREVERDGYYHEFHYWLAAACWRLGDADCTRKHLASAIENSRRAATATSTREARPAQGALSMPLFGERQAQTLLTTLGIEIVEATKEKVGRPHARGTGGAPALRPAARRRVSGARGDRRLDRRLDERGPGEGAHRGHRDQRQPPARQTRRHAHRRGNARSSRQAHARVERPHRGRGRQGGVRIALHARRGCRRNERRRIPLEGGCDCRGRALPHAHAAALRALLPLPLVPARERAPPSR